MAEVVLAQLFAKTTSIDINTRHGAVLALGEITNALLEIQKSSEEGQQEYISSNINQQLNGLLGTFLYKDLFRGKFN